MTVATTSPVELIILAQSVASRVEILIDGKNAGHVTSTEAHIINTGNKAILAPRVKLELDGQARILAVEPMTMPAGQEADTKLTFENSSVEIDTPHLNAGSEISFRILAEGDDFSIKTTFAQPDVTLRERRLYQHSLFDPAVTLVFEAIHSNFWMHAVSKIAFAPYQRYLKSLENGSGQ